MSRATIPQAQLNRSAAAIAAMAARLGKTQSAPRFGFLELASGHMLAFPARAGAKTVRIGRERLAARMPATDLEREAVASLAARGIRTAKRANVPAIMARKIVEVAASGRAVERADFAQAGIADALIGKHFDAAMALARRAEPKLDQMVAA